MQNSSFFSDLCFFISSKERLELFDLLCENFNFGTIHTARVVERVSMELKIKRSNVYRYMKVRKRRFVPNEQTTARIIESLIKYGRSQSILPFMKRGSERMSSAAKVYRKWVKNREDANSPFSRAEFQRLCRGMTPNLVIDKKALSSI